MAEKDFREKKFISFNDIFADIINVLLFNGSNRVKDTDLESGGMLRSGYKVDDRFAEQERDVKKYWLNGSVRLAVLELKTRLIRIRISSFGGSDMMALSTGSS